MEENYLSIIAKAKEELKVIIVLLRFVSKLYYIIIRLMSYSKTLFKLYEEFTVLHYKQSMKGAGFPSHMCFQENKWKCDLQEVKHSGCLQKKQTLFCEVVSFSQPEKRKSAECTLRLSKELICTSLSPYCFSQAPKTDSSRHFLERGKLIILQLLLLNILIFVNGGCESRNEVIFQCQGLVYRKSK